MPQKKHAVSSALLAVVLFSGAACFRKDGTASPSSAVVAVVNSKEIMGEDFKKEYSAFKRRINVSDANDEDTEKRMRDGVLEDMIRNELIAQEAEKAGVRVSKDAVDEAVGALTGGLPPASLNEMLAKQNQTFEEWKASVLRNLLLEKFITVKTSKLVEVREDEVRRFYDDRQKEFNMPNRARLFHILSSTPAEAEKMRQSLKDGADFAGTARKYSRAPEAEQGGDLGVVSQGQMPKELDEAIFKLKEGEISPIIKSPYGFHIFKVTRLEKAGLAPYEDVKVKIYNQMLKERSEKRFEEWFIETRKNAAITVYAERLYRL